MENIKEFINNNIYYNKYNEPYLYKYNKELSLHNFIPLKDLTGSEIKNINKKNIESGYRFAEVIAKIKKII
jgi:hypothetical protein